MKGFKQALNILVFIIFTMIVSLASASDYTQITNTNLRIDVAGVSLLPPQEKGWAYIRTHPARTEFGKLGAKEGQSFSGMVILSKLPNLNSDKEFLELISAQRSRDSGDARYEDILNEEIIANVKNTRAVRFHTKYKDYGASNLPISSAYLVIEDIGIILQHPDNKNIAVSIALSQRSKPEDANAAFVELALEFIKNANLKPLEL